jgi:hypothetical protein
MINTNAEIALKEPNECDPLDVSPDLLLEGKKEPFPYYYCTSDLHPPLFDKRVAFGVHRIKAQSQHPNLKCPTIQCPIIFRT